MSLWSQAKKEATKAKEKIQSNTPKIGGTIGQIGGQVKKAYGDAWSMGVKQPIQATYQSIATGSTKPLEQYGQSMMSQIKRGVKNIGQTAGILPQQGGGGQAGPMQGAAAAPDYSKYGLNLTGFAQGAPQQDMQGMISGNESPEAAQQRIASQFGQMSQLAKLREGSQRQSEQSAMARRLAASGMGGSGAGMRMAALGEQAAGRRAAETQLGIGAEQAAAERQAMETATGRNLQREAMRLGAAESARDYGLRERGFQAELEERAKAFAREGDIIAENQKIAREIQRYNDQGLIGQLGQDIFGSTAKRFSVKDFSWKNPYGFSGGIGGLG